MTTVRRLFAPAPSGRVRFLVLAGLVAFFYALTKIESGVAGPVGAVGLLLTLAGLSEWWRERRAHLAASAAADPSSAGTSIS